MATLNDLHTRSAHLLTAMQQAEGIAFDLKATSLAIEALRAQLQATMLWRRCIDDPQAAAGLDEGAHSEKIF